jgi:superfamily II DNA or RNA helicase
MLRDVNLQPEYRSGRDDLVPGFYHPCLNNSDVYWRAVGYFSSSALEVLGAPLGNFVARGGTMRLVTSVELHERDVEAIKRGLSRKAVCEARLLEQIRAEFSGPVPRGVVLLTALLEASQLEIRIALPRARAGIYHEKVGVFIARDGDEFVAFAGSSNESRHAYEENYECIDVYPSWSEQQRARSKRDHFERLWTNTEVGVESMEFPEAVRQELIRVVRASEASQRGALLPDRWRHQDTAVAAFMAAKCGVLEMATGTGKTRVAMRVMSDLAASGDISTVIVSADGTDLLDQWVKQLYGVAANQLPRWRVLQHFHQEHERSDFLLDPQGAIFVTSRPELGSALKRLHPDARAKALLVHDEVHRLGSPSNVRDLDGLAVDIPYRLGLSATPDREYDAAGTNFILQHIGPKLFEFSLGDAIKRGVLCEFNYVPLEYERTDEDRAALQRVHHQKLARQAAGTPMSQEEISTAIARVYKRSKAKLPKFEHYLAEHPEALDRCIVFVEDRAYGGEVLLLVHAVRHDFHTYYHEDDKDNLEEFARGNISCLITCHRLSEGIDIRSLRNVVLFSSHATRLETTQRMGRCLRTDPDDLTKRATVVDFVRVEEDEEDKEPNADQRRCEWLRGLSQIKREER